MRLRDRIFQIGCAAISWALIISVTGCVAQKPQVVAVPTCLPLTTIPAGTEKAAYDELRAHPDTTHVVALIRDWITLRDEDRACLARQQNNTSQK